MDERRNSVLGIGLGLITKIHAFLERSPSSSSIDWKIIKEFVEEKNELKQVSILKKVGCGLRKLVSPGFEESHFELLITILTDIHVNAETRTVLRRTIVSVLQSLPDSLHRSIINGLQVSLTNHIGCCDLSDQSSCRMRVDTIQSLMENFSLGEAALKVTLNPVFKFMDEVLHTFTTVIRNNVKETAVEQSTSMHHCLATVKTSRILIHKCFSELRHEGVNIDSELGSHLENIRIYACHILKYGIYSADCQNAAGMTFILITQLLSEQALLAKEIADAFTSKLVDYSNLAPLSKLFVCQGVLVTVSNDELTRRLAGDGAITCNHASLLGNMFHQIWGFATVLLESFAAISVARVLALWTECALTYIQTKRNELFTLEEFTGYQDIPHKLLEYSWTNWDHPIDCMRHQVNSIFSNVIKLHRKSVAYSGSLDCNDDAFICELLQKILLSDRHVRGKYTFLACLVEAVGARFILQRHPSLPQDLYSCMLDQNLSPCIGNLVDVMAKDHLKRMLDSSNDDWLYTWIDSLLRALHNCPPIQQKSYIMQVTLPKLIKCNPSSAQYIIETLQSRKWNDLDAQGMRPLDIQGVSVLDVQDSKQIDRQCSSHLDYNGMRLCMLMTCLKTARASNFVAVEYEDNSEHNMWHGLVKMTTIKQALCHKNNQVRLDTFALICDTRKTAESVTDSDFDLIQFFLPYNLSSHLPSFRQQLMMILKKLFIRLQDSGRLHYKNSRSSDGINQSQGTDRLKRYKVFLDWFVELLFCGLQPGSCYATRVSALTALCSFRKFMSDCSWYNVLSIFNHNNVQLLLKCFTDPYESNKIMAFDLLVPLSQEILGLKDAKQLEILYKVAFELSCSTRPHNCETASFMLRFISRQIEPGVKCNTSFHDSVQGILTDLLDSLSEQVEVAARSLIEAAGTRPMYGVLHCIRELVADLKFDEMNDAVTTSFKSRIHRLLVLCYKVANAVSPIVCNSSPEGYLPTNRQQEESDVSDIDVVTAAEVQGSKVLNVTPQALVVCCWRSMKEVSLTLGNISQQHELNQTLLSQQQVTEMGDFFIKLLLESKHRGAFELASVGFNQLCVVLWRSKVVPLQSLPRKWLNDLLNDVCAGGDLLCATRRSAGVPFTIQALVTSEPNSLRRQCLQETMNMLLPLALPTEQDGKEVTPQVHALNIMCALFRDARIGDNVYPYIADGMKAALLGFKSKLWIVRNSSTLLFTALINRIFGVRRQTEELARKNCMTGREFFTRFSSLHIFLLEELSACIQVQTNANAGYLQPSLFPILLLLSRLYPSPTDGADANLSLVPFVPLVKRCGSSAIHKTRTMAATALASLIPSSEISKMVTSLINSLPKTQTDECRQNQIHGLLLQIRHLIHSHLKVNQHSCDAQQHNTHTAQLLQQAISTLKDFLWLATSVNNCAITRTEFLNILNLFVLNTSWLASTCGNLVPEFVELQEEVIQLASDDQTLPDSVPLDHVELMKAIAFADIHKPDISDKIGICVQDNHGEESVKTSCSVCLNSQICTRALVKHLSSNLHEVRLLILEHILDRLKLSSHCKQDHHCSRDKPRCKCKDVFKQLVSMLSSEGHHDCLVKVLEVISMHPLTIDLPWFLEDGHQLTSKQLASLVLHLSTGDNVRDNLVAGVLSVSSVLVPFLYGSITKDVKDQSPRDLIQYTVEVMEQHSFAEHTIQLRLVIAQALVNNTLHILIDPEHHLGGISLTGWRVVLRLLQDNDSDVRACMACCVSSIAKNVPSVYVKSLYYWDVHPHLALQLAIEIMFKIHLTKNLCPLYKMVFDLVMGKSEDFVVEETEEDKLFDRGEANTNNEEVIFLKMLVKSFLNAANEHTQITCKLDNSLSQSVLIMRLEDFLCLEKYEQLRPEQSCIDAPQYESIQLQLIRIYSGLLLFRNTAMEIDLRKVNELWNMVQEKCYYPTGYKFKFDKFLDEM